MQRHIAQRSALDGKCVTGEGKKKRKKGKGSENKWKLEGLIMQISNAGNGKRGGAEGWEGFAENEKMHGSLYDCCCWWRMNLFIFSIWADLGSRFTLYFLHLFRHYHTVSNGRQLPSFCLTITALLVGSTTGRQLCLLHCWKYLTATEFISRLSGSVQCKVFGKWKWMIVQKLAQTYIFSTFLNKTKKLMEKKRIHIFAVWNRKIRAHRLAC